MTQRQLVFDLPVRTAMGRDDFFVSPSNRDALAMIELWPAWSPPKLVLTGAPGSGKSHLASVWAATSGATTLDAGQLPDRVVPGPVVVEDAHRIGGDSAAETALFHLHNHVLEAGGTLLITGRGAVATWGLVLPDLVSRLQAAGQARLAEPDDALLSAVLVKLFDDRQLIVAPEIISYLVPRIERSIAAAQASVAAIDRAALRQQRRVTRALVATVLNDAT